MGQRVTKWTKNENGSLSSQIQCDFVQLLTYTQAKIEALVPYSGKSGCAEY